MKKSFIAPVVLLALMTVAAWGETETWKSGSTTVTLTDDGKLTISGKGPMENYNILDKNSPKPPWLGVRISIANSTMKNVEHITSAVIEDGVTSIGDGVFAECSRLTSVTIAKSVKTIGNFAFVGSVALASITIPEGVTSIGAVAFGDCNKLTSVTIPNSVTLIDKMAFNECLRLTSVNIGSGAKTIEQSAFAAPKLASINVAANNPNYSSADGVMFNKNKTVVIMCPRGKEGAYVIPKSVTEIGDYAFTRCAFLTSLTIPAGVKSIGKGAFQQSLSVTPRLESIISLNPVPPSIGQETFYGIPLSACLYVPQKSIDAYREAWRDPTATGRGPRSWKEFKCVEDLEDAPK
ncbi:MAG: leucine-rich repeat protein [Chitinispirillia bacterium]|nr:leucine-rich repeat protein [Chitinispirillia bacterium]MCL2241724.1 leucine-rich repeat protein [Chitinispirillia bacterium]